MSNLNISAICLYKLHTIIIIIKNNSCMYSFRKREHAFVLN